MPLPSLLHIDNPTIVCGDVAQGQSDVCTLTIRKLISNNSSIGQGAVVCRAEMPQGPGQEMVSGDMQSCDQHGMTRCAA